MNSTTSEQKDVGIRQESQRLIHLSRTLRLHRPRVSRLNCLAMTNFHYKPNQYSNLYFLLQTIWDSVFVAVPTQRYNNHVLHFVTRHRHSKSGCIFFLHFRIRELRSILNSLSGLVNIMFPSRSMPAWWGFFKTNTNTNRGLILPHGHTTVNVLTTLNGRDHLLYMYLLLSLFVSQNITAEGIKALQAFP